MSAPKFKAWDNKYNRWFKPNPKERELLLSLNGRQSIRSAGGFIDEVAFPNRFIIRQFIEAYDVKGKEIYESYIVQHKDRPDMSGIVRISHGSAFAVGRSKTDDRKEVWSGAFIERNCIVIGNGHEHPELMNWFIPEKREA